MSMTKTANISFAVILFTFLLTDDKNLDASSVYA